MSKISGIRMVNINYNNNSMKIDDEYYDLNGENTLISLRNGGGKSVLVQMMIAPFVHKRYRNTTDRTFSSFFTTNKPSFIMIEWLLDGTNNRLLTGMMVRKSQDTKEENPEELEIITFVHEYTVPNQYDIRLLPIIDEENGIKQLKGFQSCKKLFETNKQNGNNKFNYYDLNNSGQQKNYFEKLRQYQINYKEWETIIKRVNLKESGLSELFTEAKDEHGLVEKWFLPAVEDKLNQEENRMQQFEDILGKYIKQYKDNKSKLERKETIHLFIEKTNSVYESAIKFKESLDKKADGENKIASLARKLNELKQSTEEHKIKINDELDSCNQKLKDIHFEKDSLSIYKKMDELDKSITMLNEKNKIIEDIISEIEAIKTKQNILQCSKYYGIYQNSSEEVQQIESMLDIARKKGEDLVPERNLIGYNLRLFFEQEEKRLITEINMLDEQYHKLKSDIDDINKSLDNLNSQDKSDAIRSGKLLSDIKSYDQIERRFNELYNEELARNILGYYENGLLNQLGLNFDKVFTEHKKQLTENRKKIMELGQLIDNDRRNGEDYQKDYNIKKTELSAKNNEMESFEDELTQRKHFLKLLSLSEDNLLNKSKLITTFDEKIKETDDLLYSMQREQDELLIKYKKIKTGKILELSKELEEALDLAGIKYIYGMDWLKKNNYQSNKNVELVNENPFLPYSLIMSYKECDKLLKASLNVFTSFPIPVVVRERLEDRLSEPYYDLNDKIKFYICFNDRLLDENQVSEMLVAMDEQIDVVANRIEQKKKEKKHYSDKRDDLQKQSVNEEKYNKCKNHINTLTEDIKELDKLIFSTKENIKKYENEKNQKEKECSSLENKLNKFEQKQKEFTDLKVSYDFYLNQIDEKTVLDRECEKRTAEIISLKKDNEFKQNELNDKRKNRDDKSRELNDIKKEGIEYSSFNEGEILNKDIEDLKARFKAITSNNTEEKLLEEQLARAKERFRSDEDELIKFADKHNISEKEYKEVIYDRFTEDELEDCLNKSITQKNIIEVEKVELDKKKAVLEHDIKGSIKRFEAEYHTEVLKPKEEIVIRDFGEDITRCEFIRNEKNEELSNAQQRIDIYDSNLATLAEYDVFTLKEEVVFEENFERFNKDEWNKFRGQIVRDYKTEEKKSEGYKQLTWDVLQKVSGNPCFSDDFYADPLKRFDELKAVPDMLLEQIKLTWNSYDNLLKKLEVDLAFLGTEKDKIAGMLLDYLKDAHRHMNSIDKNSSITVRGRSIKMLRIKLPAWEEQEEVYTIRMKDFIEVILDDGLNLLEVNEQIEEMIGKQITTRNLYDRIIGIGNVEIKLYKIEEQREYPISWAEVAKNSGGEGFLSAFVILSSLLSFMRRDETDIFAESEESKVLIMDNPFAQTSSSHLLKPLVEVAEKSRTQLICLSGLGGESIYNRFDQIYVLTLVPSSLRNSLSYLRSDHVKGEENNFLLTSALLKVEEMEQMSLF